MDNGNDRSPTSDGARGAAPATPTPSDRAASVTKRRGSRGKWLVMLVVTIVSCSADQASKHWSHTTLRSEYSGRKEIIKNYFSLTYVRNPGAAWGFLARKPASFRRPFFLAVSVIAVAFILYLFVRLDSSQRLLTFALSMVMGGAIGNFIDRARFGYVIDFLDCYVGGSFKWPTFNVADIGITVGVSLLFIEMIITTLSQWRQRRAAAHATPPDLPRPIIDPPEDDRAD